MRRFGVLSHSKGGQNNPDKKDMKKIQEGAIFLCWCFTGYHTQSQLDSHRFEYISQKIMSHSLLQKYLVISQLILGYLPSFNFHSSKGARLPALSSQSSWLLAVECWEYPERKGK